MLIHMHSCFYGEKSVQVFGMDQTDLQSVTTKESRMPKIEFLPQVSLVGTTDKRLQLLELQMRKVKNDITLVQEDITLVKEDIKLVKEDITLVKEDIKLVKEDIKLVKEDIKLVKKNVKKVNESLKNQFELLKIIVKALENKGTLKSGTLSSYQKRGKSGRHVSVCKQKKEESRSKSKNRNKSVQERAKSNPKRKTKPKD